MTVSNTPKAVVKNIIFTTVLRVKQGLPPAKLAEFKADLYKDTIPRACQVNAQNDAFNKIGLFYTFLVYNTYDENLSEIVVGKAVCDNL